MRFTITASLVLSPDGSAIVAVGFIGFEGEKLLLALGYGATPYQALQGVFHHAYRHTRKMAVVRN